MINIDEYLPPYHLAIWVYLMNGNRRKAILRPTSMGFHALDCTHPLSNCHISIYEVTGWNYIRSNDALEYPPVINRYKHIKMGEQILNSIKHKPKLLSYMTINKFWWIIVILDVAIIIYGLLKILTK